MEVAAHPHGSFCFAELNTPDLGRAKSFYGELLGWSAFDVPSAAGAYSLLQVRGRIAAGLHRTDRLNSWLTYVSVESADRSAALAQELGGAIRTAPFDVQGVGRMAMLADPAGGVLALWEAKGLAGVGLLSEPGAMTWNELVVQDVPLARGFYQRLFGWTASETRVPSGPCTVFELAGRPVAGLMEIGADWEGVVPHWQVYFALADCDAAVARARAMGGSVVFGPQDVPNEGRFAALADPAKAVFAVIQPLRVARAGGAPD